MTPAKRTEMYLTAAVMGFAATILFIAGEVFALPDLVRGFSLGLLLVSLLALLVRRLRDEFIERLWSAGASLAFAAVVLSFLFGPFLEGLFDGISAAAPRQDFFFASWVGPLALVAFFTGFHFAWWRNSR